MKKDTNAPIVYSKCPKWAKKQEIWAKLGEWVVTIIKRNVSDTNIGSIQYTGVACLSGKNIILMLWFRFEIFIIKKCQQSLFCRYFCFSFSWLIPAKCEYISRISVYKSLMKKIMFSQEFRLWNQGFLKELRNCPLRTEVTVLFNTALRRYAFSTVSFEKLVFRFKTLKYVLSYYAILLCKFVM